MKIPPTNKPWSAAERRTVACLWHTLRRASHGLAKLGCHDSAKIAEHRAADLNHSIAINHLRSQPPVCHGVRTGLGWPLRFATLRAAA